MLMATGALRRTAQPWLLLLSVCVLSCWAPSVGILVNSTVGHNVSEGTHATLADMLGEKLRQEFVDDVEKAGRQTGKTFNETARNEKASMETVVVISNKHKKNGTVGAPTRAGNSGLANADMGLDPGVEEVMPSKTKSDHEPDVDRIVDSQDNEYVLSKSKEASVLTLDPLLIQDLTILISSSATVGWLFEGLGQPVINGYLVAGSAVGPGGFKLIKELVQVESLAQLGVHFLLFHLGLEFSFDKMKGVGGVALVGGLLQMFIFITVACIASVVTQASLPVAFFVGALVSLSSTSVVINCLEAKQRISSRAGQITVGTLILQDCTVGLLFALMPLLVQDHSSMTPEQQYDETAMLLVGILLRLGAVLVVTIAIARLVLPVLVRFLARSVSVELFQISLVGFCLLGGHCVGALGVSRELGAFISGAMVSATDQHEYAVKAIEGVRNLFTALFISSIGLVMPPKFLWEHIDLLTVCTVAIVVVKSMVVFGVVKMFRFDSGTALMVGLSLAQISEFAFVLLSVAQDSGLIQQELYLMLLGLAALSLFITPGIISVAAIITGRMNFHVEPVADVHLKAVELIVLEKAADGHQRNSPATGHLTTAAARKTE